MSACNRFVKSGLVLLCFFLCTGCWSKVEINERTFITAMYIDKGEKPGDIELTLSMPLPNRLAPEGGGSSKSPYAIVSANAPTIADALERIQTDLTRKISWGHTRVVVFGEAYAKEGIQDTLAWIAREPLFHLSSYIMVAKGKAKDVSDLTPVFEETPSDVLREFSTEENLLKTQVLNVFAADKMNQGFASPILTAQQRHMASEEGELKKWVSQSGGALFKQMKMVASLSDDEARAVAWAERTLDSLSISVKTKKEKASMTIYDMHSDVHVRLERGEPIFDIKLNGKAELNSVIPVLKAKDIVAVRDIEQAASEKVSAHLRNAIQTGKNQGADILRLGYRLEWRYPEMWKKLRPKWITYVKNDLQYKVTTDINIQFVGSESSF
ncbi:Ger(x)C family spore germination protein [Paenibacillus xylanilyticus]|uniref:Ger(x)C family spore germination protein n=1 Tax=Paenibacillus xylanilyticus TaxID=248903 RepID=UPI00129E88FA|nr:Ger(x)C family spore germination protein [Paenibacillus xylanilyticus]